MFDDGGTPSEEPSKGCAREWFTRYVDDTRNARFPAIEVDGELVATAIGTLEIGVPNPQCVRGRTVRLANVITVPSIAATVTERCSCSTSWPGPDRLLPTVST